MSFDRNSVPNYIPNDMVAALSQRIKRANDIRLRVVATSDKFSYQERENAFTSAAAVSSVLDWLDTDDFTQEQRESIVAALAAASYLGQFGLPSDGVASILKTAEGGKGIMANVIRAETVRRFALDYLREISANGSPLKASQKFAGTIQGALTEYITKRADQEGVALPLVDKRGGKKGEKAEKIFYGTGASTLAGLIGEVLAEKSSNAGVFGR